MHLSLIPNLVVESYTLLVPGDVFFFEYNLQQLSNNIQ